MLLSDEEYLRRAIRMAGEGREAGNAPFGSILVNRSGVVLAEEYNTVITDRDITAHPELKLARRWASGEWDPGEHSPVTMFTSCQPCPMCATAIDSTTMSRVVYALSSEQLRSLKLAGGINPDSAVVDYDGPYLDTQAQLPFKGYYE